MEELKNIASKLEKALKQKEEVLAQREERNEYDWGLLRNRQTDVKNYWNAIDKISTDPFLKKTIIKNFTVEADKILKEIELIK